MNKKSKVSCLKTLKSKKGSASAMIIVCIGLLFLVFVCLIGFGVRSYVKDHSKRSYYGGGGGGGVSSGNTYTPPIYDNQNVTESEIAEDTTEVLIETAPEVTTMQVTVSSGNVNVGDIKIVREDRTIKDGDKVLAEWYYDKVVLENTNDVFKRINSLIEQDCANFFSSNPQYEEEVREFAGNDQGETDTFVNTCEADIIRNNGHILSIKITTSWYEGGVCNGSYYGLNYNLDTGEEVSLNEVFGKSENETSNYIKDVTIQYINEHPDYGWWDNGIVQSAVDVVSNYNFSDFKYYMDMDNVYICYPVYELGPGSMGSVIVQCPIV